MKKKKRMCLLRIQQSNTQYPTLKIIIFGLQAPTVFSISILFAISLHEETYRIPDERA